jgi:mannose-6-phosphate isomerase-like protein (cupin superfamily)
MLKPDLSKEILGLFRDGRAEPLEWKSGPPPHIDGYTIGAPLMTRPAPHNGEMHPDGDELLYVVSGRMDVILEEQGSETTVEVTEGQSLVVPKGTWHRVIPREPTRLFHITPGPHAEWRPLRNR